jgi:ABC-type sugar transport system permease subunit
MSLPELRAAQRGLDRDRSELVRFAVTALGAVIIRTMWKTYPFFTIMLLAALQSIPRELYEATVIDGAGPWQLLRRHSKRAGRCRLLVYWFVRCW